MTPEELLQRAAEKIIYPPTPRIHLPIQQHKKMNIQWVLRGGAILLVMIVLLVSSPVRAALREIFKIGSVQVSVDEATPNPALTRLERIAGETTLEKAQAQVDFPLALPQAYGLPQQVFVQNWVGQMVVMLWRDETDITLALYQFNEGFGLYKTVENAVVTEVDGDFALWIDQPHELWLRDGNIFHQQTIFFVEGNVLIWDENGITYRLESGLSLEEAIQIAENLGTLSELGGSTEE